MAAASPVLVAGVDSSTQSTTVEIREFESGVVVGRGSAPHPTAVPPRSEQDPAAWWSAFEAAWQAAGAPNVAAISVAGQQHGMVTLDASGAIVRPAKLWNDTEAAADAAWLTKQLPGGAADWAAAVGSVPVAAFTVCKLSWMHRTEPELWQRVAQVLLPHDWMTQQLTGQFVTDRGDASGTGYWSAATSQYQWDILGIIDSDRDWSAMLPREAGPAEVVGHWCGAAVGCGTGDNMAAALGLGLAVGTAVVSLGTSGTAYCVSDTPTSDASGEVAGFADASGRFLPLVCTLNATRVTDTVAELLGAERAEFAALAMQAPVGAQGITVLPYFDGERTPNLPSSTGLIGGLRTGASRADLARAAFEGVACGLLDALDSLRRHVQVDNVVLVGGGARSAAYREVFAALCDLPVSTADADEAVAAGACVQAAALLGEPSHAQIAARWGLTARRPIDVAQHRDAAQVRHQYAALRRAATLGDPGVSGR